ncbi:MAG: class I SAM-dependent methyltransferase [Synergistaceae bacterium]|nr:class I SAM-dependent methyltransferase [Synergistaceae bacterium]
MKKTERYFLNGIIRALRPRKLLEAGIAAGGGSAIILNAISDIDGAELYSVDYLEESITSTEKHSGFLVEEKFPEFLDKWHVFRGGDVSHFIEEIGGDIDLFMLDTVHTHPWETLNFLCVLPFMKDDSWVVLHDISLFAQERYRYNLACRYLFSSVVSEDKVVPAPDAEDKILPNIGAFRVSELTRRFAGNLFEALVIPWNMQLLEKDLADISKVIERHYPAEQYEFFCRILEFQHYLFTHPQSMKSALYGSVKQRLSPKTFSFLNRIRRKLKL